MIKTNESMNLRSVSEQNIFVGTAKAKLGIKIHKTNHANNCKCDVLLKH